eukprot:Gb_15120 [translate_table: standard]
MKSQRSKPNGCFEKASSNAKIELSFAEVYEKISCLKDSDLICKFKGLLSLEKMVREWISTNWRTTGTSKLIFCARGFFTVIFSLESDKNLVFEGDPWFLNRVGLFMKPWSLGFDPMVEEVPAIPVWV